MVLLLLAFSFAAGIITQSVGLVGKDVVTSREVQMASTIDKIINTSGSAKINSFFEVQPKDPRFAELTTTYLLERAAVMEGESFSVGLVIEDEIKAAIAQIEKATQGKSYWQSLEPDSETVKKITATKLISRNFIKLRSESMTGIMTDAEAQAYFQKNRLKFGTATFESFKENIKVFLAQQQKEEKLRSWFELLKKKYKIRNLLIEGAKAPQ